MKKAIQSYFRRGLVSFMFLSGIFPAILASNGLMTPVTFEQDVFSTTIGGLFATIETRIPVTLTGYSSTVDQTDDTPFVTAANTWVRDGIVATNFLPLYTRVQIPELFGDKVFVVEDRMHSRFNDRMDIWFESRELAKQFGKRTAEIVILSGSGYDPTKNINYVLAMN